MAGWWSQLAHLTHSPGLLIPQARSCGSYLDGLLDRITQKVGKDVEKQLRGFGVHMRHRRKDTAQKSDQLPPEYKIQGAAILGNKCNEINPHDAPKQPGNSQVMGANG